MPVEMHNQGQDRCVLTCTECKQRVDTGWFCYGCEDSDLCTNCYNTKGHPHHMVKLGLGLYERAQEGDEDPDQRELRLRRLWESWRLRIVLSIQRLLDGRRSRQCSIRSLVHSHQCRDANCRRIYCRKTKRIVRHTKRCLRRNDRGCPRCNHIINLCYCHALYCQENPCPVPFCLNIKQNLRQQRLRLRQQRIGNRLPQG